MVLVNLESYWVDYKDGPKPIATNNITIVKRTFTNIKFKRSIVETNVSIRPVPDPSIHLATIKIKNGQVYQESVLGLVCIQIIMFLHRRYNRNSISKLFIYVILIQLLTLTCLSMVVRPYYKRMNLFINRLVVDTQVDPFANE